MVYLASVCLAIGLNSRVRGNDRTGVLKGDSKMAKAKDKVSFEDNMGRLETIVSDLERQTLPLDDALSLYEEGVGLIKTCQKILTTAEQKVTLLSETQDE